MLLVQVRHVLNDRVSQPLGRDERSDSRTAGTLLNLARRHRAPVAYSAYALATAVAFLIGYAARFDLAIPSAYTAAIPLQLGTLIVLRLAVGRAMHLMEGRWRYVGVDDVLRLGCASTLSSALFASLFRGFPALPNVPWSVVLIEWAVFTLGVAAMWVLYRRGTEWAWNRGVRDGEPPRRRLVVVGSGEAGNVLAREINRMPSGYRVVGFLDDDPLKRGTRVQGIPVLGAVSEATQVLEAVRPDEIAIAIPSARPATLRRIVSELEPVELPFKVLPGIQALIHAERGRDRLRPLRIEDLLGREPVSLELPELERDLEGKTVLVTGAAGSIGSELARQVAANRPDHLVLLDQAESALYWIDLELRHQHPALGLEAVVADLCNEARMKAIIERVRPHQVFHAAAYKHVPLMEHNPSEAIYTNVLGTWKLAQAAGRAQVERFVFISTDKAADPINVMGATKRAAEIVVQRTQDRYPNTRFTAVRFGNVLGSNGSVIPLFQKQIARGGPVTVTHPDVTRYFMTIPEAAQLVLQAGLLEEAKGEIVMLEMGESVSIVELAHNLIRLGGKRPGIDIKLEFTGLRPGEKLHERLVGTDEDLRDTSLEGVRILRSPAARTSEKDLQTVVELARNCAVELEPAIGALLHLVRPRGPSRDEAVRTLRVRSSSAARTG
ncbi:MAG: polysaccharide biosynthesis protein [Gemmatimonadales bacterium]|nr:MAG: polysaccharide biosynthesis protein [Gemmatimonadales bacterium]